MDLSCVFYDYRLLKKIPCTLIPNFFPTSVSREDASEREYFVKVSFDYTKFSDYNVSGDETLRYSKEYVNLFDIYPITTQDEIDYANACIPNLIPDVTTHSQKELDRFEKIINMLCSTSSINKDIFYIIFDFIIYELLFRYCTSSEKTFLINIANTELTEVPDPIPIQQIIRMINTIKTKYEATSSNDIVYRIYNFRNISEFDVYNYPILLNIPIFYANIDYLIPYI